MWRTDRDPAGLAANGSQRAGQVRRDRLIPRSVRFLESLDERPVLRDVDVDELRRALGGPLPERPDRGARRDRRSESASRTRRYQDAERALVWLRARGQPSGRTRRRLAYCRVGSKRGLFEPAPAAGVVEEFAGEWMRELFELPGETSFGSSPGCQMAHVTCLAAARNHVLAAHGWDVEKLRVTLPSWSWGCPERRPRPRTRSRARWNVVAHRRDIQRGIKDIERSSQWSNRRLHADVALVFPSPFF